MVALSIWRGTLARSVAGLGVASVLMGGASVAYAEDVSASATTAKTACRAARMATAGVQQATDDYKAFADSTTTEGARADFATLVTGWHRAVEGARAKLAATPAAGSPKVLTAFLATFRAEDEVLARAASKVGTLPPEARAFLDARLVMTQDILAAARATDVRLARLQAAERKVAACAAITRHEQAFQTWRR